MIFICLGVLFLHVPSISAANDFFIDLRHSLKSEENNISGMANGTVIFIIQSCMFAMSIFCRPSKSIIPLNDKIIPKT